MSAKMPCQLPTTSKPVQTGLSHARLAVAPKTSRSGKRSRGAAVVFAEKKESGLQGVVDLGRSTVDTVASWVPESVPRPVAKGGVAVVGGLVIWTILTKIVSTVVTLVVLGAAGYFFFLKSSSSSSSSSSKEPGGDSAVSLDDPVEEAKRIMGKYK